MYRKQKNVQFAALPIEIVQMLYAERRMKVKEARTQKKT
eukprot:jgi/Antlo1/2012/324